MPPGSELVLFVTELSGHGDEGMRNWIKLADRALTGNGHRTEILRLKGDPRWSSLSPGSLRSVRRIKPEILVYVPYSGLTSKALLRHLALRGAARPRTDLLVTLQSDPVVRRLPMLVRPRLVAYASERLREEHRDVGRDSCVMPPVVDQRRFCPSTDSRKAIREELGIPDDRPMFLHVGHLRSSRGLGPLAELAEQGSVNVVVLASTATEPEAAVEARLRASGAIVKREYLPAIERWYQAADVYVFPVVDLQGSIEIPLTVLEAMACGVPVASTQFGGLSSLFAQTDSLRFAAPARLADVARAMVEVDGGPNRDAVAGMDEATFASALEDAIALGAPNVSKVIALCGIDGTGKSTQASLLQERLQAGGRSTQVLWCRWDPLLARPAVRLLDRLSRRPGSASRSRAGSANGQAPGNVEHGDSRRALKRRLLAWAPLRKLWTGVMVLDYGLQVAPRLLRARRSAEVVIVDRYRHDVIIDLSAGGELLHTPLVLRWLLPAPDVLVVLDVDEDTALARKPDSPDLTYLRDRRRLYRELALDPSAILIDASEPTDVVSDAVFGAIDSRLEIARRRT
jgi:thymidylate kinase